MKTIIIFFGSVFSISLSLHAEIFCYDSNSINNSVSNRLINDLNTNKFKEPNNLNYSESLLNKLSVDNRFDVQEVKDSSDCFMTP